MFQNFLECGKARNFRVFQNVHKGYRAFVIGNGPSLKTPDLDKLKNELTFSSNKIYLAFDETDWRPNYYAVEDKLVMLQNFDKIRDLTGFAKFFPSNFDRWFSRIPDAIYFDLEVKFFYPGRPEFSFNAEERICWGSTITYSLIQLACYMGIREIYLIGVDHDFTIPEERSFEDENILISQDECNHFHPDYRKPGEKWFVPNLEVGIKSYEAARDAMASIGGAIYNATRGGKLEVFERVDFDKIMSAKN